MGPYANRYLMSCFSATQMSFINAYVAVGGVGQRPPIQRVKVQNITEALLRQVLAETGSC